MRAINQGNNANYDGQAEASMNFDNMALPEDADIEKFKEKMEWQKDQNQKNLSEMITKQLDYKLDLQSTRKSNQQKAFNQSVKNINDRYSGYDQRAKDYVEKRHEDYYDDLRAQMSEKKLEKSAKYFGKFVTPEIVKSKCFFISQIRF